MKNLIISDKKITTNFNESYIRGENIISDDKGICLQCEEVVNINNSTFDVIVSSLLTISNQKGYCCDVCDHAISYSGQSVVNIMKAIYDFKDKRPSINSLLSSNDESSYSWCENTLCACVGAANCSGALSENLYTKKDWILWKNKNELNVNSIIKIHLTHENRMSLIVAIKNVFNLAVADVSKMIEKNSVELFLDYELSSEDQIDDEIKGINDLFYSKNVSFNFLKIKDIPYDVHSLFVIKRK